MNIPFTHTSAVSGDPSTQIRALLGASRNLAAVELARATWAKEPDSGELAYLFAAYLEHVPQRP